MRNHWPAGQRFKMIDIHCEESPPDELVYCKCTIMSEAPVGCVQARANHRAVGGDSPPSCPVSTPCVCVFSTTVCTHGVNGASLPIVVGPRGARSYKEHKGRSLLRNNPLYLR